MSYIGLYDSPDGIEVIFYDTPEPDGEFAGYELATPPCLATFRTRSNSG